MPFVNGRALIRKWDNSWVGQNIYSQICKVKKGICSESPVLYNVVLRLVLLYKHLRSTSTSKEWQINEAHNKRLRDAWGIPSPLPQLFTTLISIPVTAKFEEVMPIFLPDLVRIGRIVVSSALSPSVTRPLLIFGSPCRWKWTLPTSFVLLHSLLMSATCKTTREFIRNRARNPLPHLELPTDHRALEDLWSLWGVCLVMLDFYTKLEGFRRVLLGFEKWCGFGTCAGICFDI